MSVSAPPASVPDLLVVAPQGDAREALLAAAAHLGKAAAGLALPLPEAAPAVLVVAEGAGVPAAALRDWLAAAPAPPTTLWVTPRPDGAEAAAALEAGAEDLLAWPASAAETSARLRSLLRRALGAAESRRRDERYRTLSLGKAEWEKTFDTITDAISIIGPDFAIRRANLALARMVGREPRELVGQICHRVLHHLDAPCPDCPVEAVFASGEARVVEGESFRTRRMFDYHAYPLHDETGHVYAALAYARDVTKEEQLKRSLRQSEKLMTVGQIAAGIAHEINNPLTAVSSYAQLLGLRATDPKAAESARRIEEGVARIHRLVQNLMSFVRASDDAFYPLDLNEIVIDTLSFSRYDLTRGDTRLTQDLAIPLPKVLGAKDQLEHLLVNLLTNARDALGGRGTIAVRTQGMADRVLLEVEDNGVGIGADDVDRIFDPFFTTKPTGKGTGLGLFIAAGIAKKHRGEITVDSRPGRGTRFTLSLPQFRA